MSGDDRTRAEPTDARGLADAASRVARTEEHGFNAVTAPSNTGEVERAPSEARSTASAGRAQNAAGVEHSEPGARRSSATHAVPERPALDSGLASQAGVAADSAALDLARQRWQHLTADERAAILARYSEYDRMGARDKQELVERARRLRETSQRVQSELSAPIRERLRQLEPEKRREAMREIVGGEARARGQEIRAKLPDAWVERLETAPPEQRIAILGQFRERHLKRIADFAIERLGTTLGIDETERRRLQALPIDQRADAVLDLRKRAIERDASENGLPPGMTAEDWRELVRLEPQEFFTRVQQYRQRRVESEDDPSVRADANDARARADAKAASGSQTQGAANEPRARGDAQPRDLESSAQGMTPRDGAVPAPPEGARAGAAPPRAPNPERMTPERREGLERLLAAVQQHAEDVIELVDLPKDERREKLFEIRRARCIEILRAYRLVSPQQMSELESLGEKRFHEVVRKVLGPLRREGPAGRPSRGAEPPKSGVRKPEIVPGRNDGGRA